MGKFNISQNSFSIGVLSPKVKGRSDLKEYKQGVERMENMIPMPAGGARKRPGLIYLHDQNGSLPNGSNTAVIPFNPNDVAGYYIEITSGTGSPDSSSFKIYKIDGTACTTSIQTSTAYPLSFPASLDPLGWRYVQSADILFLTHNSHSVEPTIITRTGDTQFVLKSLAKESTILGSNVAFVYPYMDVNVTPVTLALSGTTLTSSASKFTTDDEGRHVSIDSGGIQEQYRITTYNSSTSVTVTPLNTTVTSIAATTQWRLGAWGGTNGYPGQVTIHNQRIVWMATAAEPNKVWVGTVGNLFTTSRDFDATSDSTDAVNFAIAGSKPNKIVWAEAGASLKVGTSGEEYIVDFHVLDDNSSSYATVKQQTSHGGGDVISVNSGVSTLFISRNKKEVRQFKYNESNGSFISINLNILSDHLFEGEYSSIEKAVWQEDLKVLWVMTENRNVLYSLTLDSDAQTTAWAVHPLGYDETTFQGIALQDMAIVNNGSVDELILITSDDPLVPTKLQVMKLANEFTSQSMTLFTLNRPYFLDSAIRSYDASAKTVHSGFDALEGSTVQTLVDGFPGGSYLVTGGEITLDTAANELIAGYPYAASIKTLPIDAGGNLGDSVGVVKRVDEASIRFHRTYAATFGDHYTDSVGNLEQIEFDNDGTLYNGIKSVKMPNGYEIDGDYHIVVEDSSPTPMSVLSITYKGQSGN